MRIFYLYVVLFSLTYSDAFSQTKNNFNLNSSLIPIDEILSGGPPKDGIPSIDSPLFFDINSAQKNLPLDSKAIIVEYQNEIKAYPLPILNWHEIVNDTIGDKKITITYCPLCGTGVVFERTLDKKNFDFGVSGLLYQSDVLLYDRQTNSLWSQLMRQAVTGEMKGKKLVLYPSKLLPLFDYLKKNPSTKILSTKTGHVRDYNKSPYGNYSSSDSLYFPVKKLDPSIHPKTWALLIENDSKHLIVTINAFKEKEKEKTFTLGKNKIIVNFDKKESVLHCKENQPHALCMSGYFFALKTFYPDALVINQ